MSKALLIIMVAMYQNDFALNLRQKENFVALTQFVVLFYAPHFLQSSLAMAAPRLDHAL